MKKTRSTGPFGACKVAGILSSFGWFWAPLSAQIRVACPGTGALSAMDKTCSNSGVAPLFCHHFTLPLSFCLSLSLYLSSLFLFLFLFLSLSLSGVWFFLVYLFHFSWDLHTSSKSQLEAYVTALVGLWLALEPLTSSNAGELVTIIHRTPLCSVARWPSLPLAIWYCSWTSRWSSWDGLSTNWCEASFIHPYPRPTVQPMFHLSFFLFTLSFIYFKFKFKKPALLHMGRVASR